MYLRGWVWWQVPAKEYQHQLNIFLSEFIEHTESRYCDMPDAAFHVVAFEFRAARTMSGLAINATSNVAGSFASAIFLVLALDLCE
jgi:hypothetical protein